MRSPLRPFRVFAACAALASLTAVRADAQSWTFDFSALATHVVPDGWGDVPGLLDVSFGHRPGWGNTPVDSPFGVVWASTGYNDLVDVLFTASGNGVGEITLDNLSSGLITLGAADIGAYPYRAIPVGLRVYDGMWNLLYSSVGLTDVTTHASFAPNVFDADVLHVQWSGLDAAGDPVDAFNVGIDNVAFTITPATSVPEPATFGLVGLGLAAVSTVAARRRVARRG